MNKTIIGLGAIVVGAGFAAAGTGARYGATAAHRFTLVANQLTSSLLARPCDNCVEFSHPEGAHIGGTEAVPARRHGG